MRWHRRKALDDLDQDIRDHIEQEVEENLARGMSPREARRQALITFGNVALVREDARGVWISRRVDEMHQDLRYALRVLYRNPAFSAVAVLTLALGIGANVAIFGVLYQTLLKPLPYERPEELVTLSTQVPQFPARFPKLPIAANDFLEYRRSNTTFAGLAALQGRDLNLTGGGEPERLHGARVSANFFSMLGVRAAHGRDFRAEEEQEGQDDVVMISHALWQRRFGADPSLVNRTILLDGRPHTVIGILPASLLFPVGRQLDPFVTFGPRVDVWKPAAFTRAELEQEGNYDYAVLGRLRAGITPTVAQHDMDRVARLNVERMKRKEPNIADIDFEMFAVITPLQTVFSGNVRQGLVLLASVVGVLLLMACINLTNLLLVRGSSRAREIATRASLGAARWRLVRQMLTESFVITALGGIVGVAFAAWAGRLLILYGPRTAATRPWTLDPPVVGFALAAACITGLLVGVTPSLQATRRTVQSRLHADGHTVTDRRARRVGRMLVGAQVALATALLLFAALLLHSFVNVVQVDAGFAVERVLAVDLSLPAQEYTRARTVAFYRELVDRVALRPGVAAAGAISLLPIAHEGVISTILLDTDSQQRLDRPAALRRSVTPALFAAMDIPLLAGRTFAEQERQPVAIVSLGLARKLWPGVPLSSVVGRGVRRDPADPVSTVVGVVGDIRADALDREAPSVFYHHYSEDVRRGMTLIVRTTADPRSLVPAVRAEIAQLDADLPIAAMRTMREIVSTSTAPRRFQMALVVSMALLALGLTVVGVYGVTGYTVTRRTREIGLRIALGAQRSQILRSVMADGLLPVCAGVLAGLGIGLTGAMAIRTLLFGIDMLDPLALITVTGLLLVSATVACYLPARAAAARDPVAALRAE
jgi:predicted permease